MVGFGRRRQPRISARKPRQPAFTFDSLEARRLLSTVSTTPETTITPSLASVVADWGFHWPPPGRGGGGSGGSTGSGGTVGVTNPTPSSASLTPSEIASAYGISTSATSGAGETIAIVIAQNDPNIQADLAAFDKYYGLPTASLTVENQTGGTTNLPATDPGWSLEASMDVEWAHDAAPGAKLILVEANSANTSDLMTAVQTAAAQANVVSMSWGGSEFQGETAYDGTFNNPKLDVTFVAAAGDSGGSTGAEWPAASPYVLSVGGTTLTLGSLETAWSATGSFRTGYSGGGGGASVYESAPSYQSGIMTGAGTKRATPDVSADANPNTGLAVYDSVPGEGQTGFFQVGGTSAGTPIWAGIVADADAARAAVGKTALTSTQTLTLLYGLAKSSSYSSDFHDVTSGSTFVANATKGYDMATGLGTPIANNIIAAAATTTTSTPTATKASVTVTATVPTTKTTTATKSLVIASPAAPLMTVTTDAAVSPPQALAPLAQSPISVGSSASTTSTSTATVTSSAGTTGVGQALPTPPTVGSNTSLVRSSVDTASTSTELDAPTAPPTDGLPAVPKPAEVPNPAPPWWDDALDLYYEETVSSQGVWLAPIATADFSTPLVEPETGAQTVLVAGAAIAAWATWEFRRRRSDRKQGLHATIWDRPFFFN